MPSRDYTSFSTAAKSRFRKVADALGYQQVSGTIYVKRHDGWYESFALQAAGHGNDFFYVNYGISIPDLCPVSEPKPIADASLLLWNRLEDEDGSGGFGRESKRDIEESADRVLNQYRRLALPWYDRFNSWEAIAAEFLRISPIEEARLGQHTTVYGADFRSATYGYLLIKADRPADALRWLREAERLLALPEFIARDGRVVHEKEKHARLQKKSAHEIEALNRVRQTIELIESSAAAAAVV